MVASSSFRFPASVLLLAFALSLCTTKSAEAILLGYNGDPDNHSGLHNSFNGDYFPQFSPYDDFNVTSPVNVTSVFSNNFMNYTGVTEAFWEIRKFVSEGVPGQLVAGGFSTDVTQVANGFAIPGGPANALMYTGYTITVQNLNVTLPPGKYWLAVSPKALGSSSGSAAFLYTTSGTNAVGTPPGNNGNAYIYADNPNLDPDTVFANASMFHGGENVDYSIGYNGQFVNVVPEPGSMLSLVGLAGCFWLARVRRGRNLRVVR
jgi:hypothetical protein